MNTTMTRNSSPAATSTIKVRSAIDVSLSTLVVGEPDQGVADTSGSRYETIRCSSVASASIAAFFSSQ
jgi:hypothetical protein